MFEFCSYLFGRQGLRPPPRDPGRIRGRHGAFSAALYSLMLTTMMIMMIIGGCIPPAPRSPPAPDPRGTPFSRDAIVIKRPSFKGIPTPYRFFIRYYRASLANHVHMDAPPRCGD